MRKALFILSLAPLLLSATYRERVKQVDLVQNWSQDPNDQSFIDQCCLKQARDAMQLKGTTLKVTDLKTEKDTDELTYIVVWNKPSFLKKELTKFPLKKAILYMWETPVLQPDMYEESFLKQFKRIYTWDDDKVDNKRFYKFYFPVFQPMRSDLPAFDKRKLLTQISIKNLSQHPQELYSAQEKIIQYFQDKPAGEFEFYGSGWGTEKHYLGAPEDKHAVLQNYKFSVCFENMRDVKGYITEKIFDCFAVGTIPIYWGASNISDYIPKDCFIDMRDFKNFEDVLTHIRSIDAKTFDTYQQNIRTFLESDKAKLFSEDLFNVLFLESVRFP